VQTHQQIYLSLLRQELHRSIGPQCGEGMAAQLAMAGARLLVRLLVDEQARPALQRLAIDAVRTETAVLRASPTAEFARPLFEILDANPTPPFETVDRALQPVISSLLTRSDATALALAAKLVGIDCALRDGIESAFERIQGSAPSDAGARSISDLSVEERRRLETFLRRTLPDSPDLTVSDVSVVPGGFSKQTLMIGLSRAGSSLARVVIRRDGGYSASGTSVTREYPVLAAVHRAGGAVAQPLAIEDTGDVLGTPFMVTTHESGRNLGDFLEAHRPSEAAALDLARRVAQLHAVPIDSLSNVLDPRGHGTLARVREEIGILHSAWQALPVSSFVAEAAFRWLLDHIDLADGPRVIVHRDIGMHNFLVDEDRVTAILDWEVCELGNPAEDLGYLAPTVRQMTFWPKFLSAYVAAGGHAPISSQIDFYELWGTLRLLVLISQAQTAVRTGHLADLQFAYVGEHFSQRLLQRLATKLQQLLAAVGSNDSGTAA
jgi:aminoglycoside phosphotransferase (APT) family kinase protein